MFTSKILIGFIALILSSSCTLGDGKIGTGIISGEITERVSALFVKDLEATSALAGKYGREDVKKCSDFLLVSMREEDAAVAKMKALMAEETVGLFSAALKAALIAEIGRSLSDPSMRQTFEKNFQANCSEVAGSIMMRVMRDGRTIGSRGMF